MNQKQKAIKLKVKCLCDECKDTKVVPILVRVEGEFVDLGDTQPCICTH
jgi:hypothetical protein